MSLEAMSRDEAAGLAKQRSDLLKRIEHLARIIANTDDPEVEDACRSDIEEAKSVIEDIEEDLGCNESGPH